MSCRTNGRITDYLRISVTDRCNLRCIYCMPGEGIAHRPHDEIITFEEILRLANIFVSLGVKKIRLTGGEPLVRNGLAGLIESLAKIKGIEELCLTTNGTLLPDYAERLQKAGLTRINISLDTLKAERFSEITRSDSLYHVMEGIDKVIALGMPLKLNAVVMRGVNDDEITDFVDFALSKKVTLRFIEFMKATPMWREEYFLPIEEVKSICEKKFTLSYLGKMGRGPATYYQIEGNNIIGFIKTEEANCISCNRLRLTSTGELKACLYESRGICLRNLLRNGASDWEIKDVIKEKAAAKQSIDYRSYESSKLYMYEIGG